MRPSVASMYFHQARCIALYAPRLANLGPFIAVIRLVSNPGGATWGPMPLAPSVRAWCSQMPPFYAGHGPLWGLDPDFDRNFASFYPARPGRSNLG